MITSFSRCRSATRPGSVSVRSGRCSSAVTMLSNSRRSSESAGSGLLQRVQPVRQNRAVGPRVERQKRLEIAQEERPVAVLQLQFARFEDLPILIAQDRQQDPVPQFLLDGLPVDVEVGGVGRAGAVLQHVVPPGVLGGRGAHVVGHGVENLAHRRGRAGPRPSPGSRSRCPTRGSVGRNRRWHSRACFPSGLSDRARRRGG